MRNFSFEIQNIFCLAAEDALQLPPDKSVRDGAGHLNVWKFCSRLQLIPPGYVQFPGQPWGGTKSDN